MYIPVYIKIYLCINICIYTQCVCVYISIYGGAGNGVWTAGILQALGILWLQTCSVLQEKGRMSPKAVQDHQGFHWPKGHSPMAGLSPPQVLRVGSAPQFQRAGCQRLWQVPGTEHLDRDIFSHAFKASVVYPARFQTCFLKCAPFFFFICPLKQKGGPFVLVHHCVLEAGNLFYGFMKWFYILLQDESYLTYM